MLNFLFRPLVSEWQLPCLEGAAQAVPQNQGPEHFSIWNLLPNVLHEVHKGRCHPQEQQTSQVTNGHWVIHLFYLLSAHHDVLHCTLRQGLLFEGPHCIKKISLIRLNHIISGRSLDKINQDISYKNSPITAYNDLFSQQRQIEEWWKDNMAAHFHSYYVSVL